MTAVANEALHEITLGELIRSTAEKHPGVTAVTTRTVWGASEDRTLTYAELERQSAVLARCLIAFGLERHSRVALSGWSSPQWLTFQLAIARLGAVLVPLSPLNSEHETEQILHSSQTHLCVVLGDSESPHGSTFTSRLSGLETLNSIAFYANGELTSVHGRAPKATAPEVELDRVERIVEPGDLLQIQYTSGSTGAPKGVMLTHKGVANNARLTAAQLGMAPGDRWCNPLPMFHVAGASMVNIGTIATGATNCVVPRFSPDSAFDAVEREGCRVMSTTPTMLYRMADTPLSDIDTSSLKMVTVGGAQLTPEVAARLEEDWGASILNIYGLSETSPVVTMCTPDDPDEIRRQSVGRAIPHTRVRIVDHITGHPVKSGTRGEVTVSGHGVMLGYLGDDEATRRAIRHGWFLTGDIGAVDESGVLTILGRYKEVIIRGGENISPDEIELCISQLESVHNVCVVGIPDPDLGEVPWAVVTPIAGASLTAMEVMNHVTTVLNKRKTPRQVEVWKSLPETGPGKVDRKAIRQILMDESHGEEAETQ